MSRQADKSEATRATLVSAARELFAERGYADVGTTEIVERAGSSRGAMYHHFRDKKDLFRAVYEEIQQDLLQRVTDRMAGETDPIAALESGLRAFLLSCLEPDKARIGLIDAPAVLGWREWRHLDDKYALGLVTAGLHLGMEAGALRPGLPVQPLAHMIVAALGEAGLLIAEAPEPDAARAEAEQALFIFLSGLRADDE